MGGLATSYVVLLFAGASAATWAAGVQLSRTTDALDFGLAAGNLIGGIAVQTMVLAVCDFVVDPRRPLTFLIGRLTPVLEAMLVILVLTAVLMGALLPSSTAIGPVSPASIGIVVVWVVGVYVINGVRKGPPWSVSMPGSRPGRRRRQEPHPEQPHPFASWSTARIAGLFLGACAVTLVAGVLLEVTANHLADRAGINGVIFGIAAVRLGDNALALGDIFGGNAFQLCLFVVADLIAGAPVLPSAGTLNSWLAALGIALSAVYAIGVVVRPERCWLRLGPDSLLALVLFGVGVAGLVALPR